MKQNTRSVSTLVAPLMQETNSLQANEENLKIFGTDENIRLFLERISIIDYKSEEEKLEDIINVEPFDSKSAQSNLSLNEEEDENYKCYFNVKPQKEKTKENKLIFKTINPRKIFSNTKNVSFDESFIKLKFQKRKRCKSRQPRKSNQDNMRRVFKRRLINKYLLDVLNKELKKLGYKKLFHKFPQSFAGDATKEKNKKYMNMTLLQIFEKNDSYENQDLKTFKYNLDIVKQIKNDENMCLILNKKFCDIYEEYISSDDFRKKEINRLRREKNFDESYIEKYINVALNFVDFCEQ